MEEITELVEKAKSGDRIAFNKIIERYQKMVTKTAFGFTHNYFDADDIAQETFIKAFFKLSTLKNNDHINYWLYSITINVAKNYIKRKRKNDLSFNDDIKGSYLNSKTPEQNYIETELRNSINRAIDKLPLKQKSVIILKKEQDLTFNEIAKILKISESAVKTHYSRGVDKIKKFLKKEGLYEKL